MPLLDSQYRNLYTKSSMAQKSLSSQYKKLISSAQNAKRHSYSPYSNFPVGAALLTTRGRIYTGCNIENSSYGLTICAERTAMFKAASEGERKFRAIAIVADSKNFTPPCGACRQVLIELAPNIDCVMNNGQNKQRVLKLKDLLPHPFHPKNLHQLKKER